MLVLQHRNSALYGSLHFRAKVWSDRYLFEGLEDGLSVNFEEKSSHLNCQTQTYCREMKMLLLVTRDMSTRF